MGKEEIKVSLTLPESSGVRKEPPILNPFRLAEIFQQILETGQIPESVESYVRELQPNKLYLLNPDSRFSVIFHPQELAKLMSQLEKQGNVFTILVAGSVRTMIAGSRGLKDLDVTFVSRDPRLPIRSRQGLMQRITGTQDLNTLKSPDSDLQTPLWGTVPTDGQIGIAIVAHGGRKNPQPHLLKLYLKKNSGLDTPTWPQVQAWTLADLAFIPEEFSYNLCQWSYCKFIAGGAFFLLKPQPDQPMPFRAWLFDFFGAEKELATPVFKKELAYHPDTLLPPGERNLKWLLSATESLIRGQQMAIRLYRKIPRKEFLRAAQEIQKTAFGVEVKDSDFSSISSFLRFLYSTLNNQMKRESSLLSREFKWMDSHAIQKINRSPMLKIRRSYPTATIEFLTGDLARTLFPQWAEFFNYAVPSEKNRTVRELLLAPERAASFSHPDAFQVLTLFLEKLYLSYMNDRLVKRDDFWENRLGEKGSQMGIFPRSSPPPSFLKEGLSALMEQLKNPQLRSFVGAVDFSDQYLEKLIWSTIVNGWERLFLPMPGDRCPRYHGVQVLAPLIKRIVNLPLKEALEMVKQYESQ